MKLTLRKASAIQKLINEELTSTAISVTVSIGRFDDAVTKRDEAVTLATDNLQKKSSLFEALYAIRKLSDAAGRAAGISDILADIAYLDKLSGIVKPLTAVESFSVPTDKLEAEFADLVEEKVAKSSYGGRRESFVTSTINQASVDGWKLDLANYRKRKQVLSDRLLELNIRTEIELSATTVETLKTYGIL